jgi:hypothetical protein
VKTIILRRRYVAINPYTRDVRNLGQIHSFFSTGRPLIPGDERGGGQPLFWHAMEARAFGGVRSPLQSRDLRASSFRISGEVRLEGSNVSSGKYSNA